MKKIINLMTSAMIAGAAFTTMPAMAEPMDKYDEAAEIQIVETINKTENILTLVLTAIDYPTDMSQWTTEQTGKWNDVYSAKYTKLVSMCDSGTVTENEVFNTFVSIIDYSIDKNSWTAEQKSKWDTVYNSIYNCLIKEIVTVVTTSTISETTTQTTTISDIESVINATETTTEIAETNVESVEEITSTNDSFSTTTTNSSASTSMSSLTDNTSNTYSTSDNAQITSTSTIGKIDSEKPPKTGDKQVKEWVIALGISILLIGVCGIAGIIKK